MTAPAPLVCAGRRLDREGRPVGDTCGRTFHPAGVFTPADGWPGWGIRPPTAAERDQQARAAGWAVWVQPDNSRTATCPRCRKPNPTTVAICRDLTEGQQP